MPILPIEFWSFFFYSVFSFSQLKSNGEKRSHICNGDKEEQQRRKPEDFPIPSE